jgi:hypothetical protein
MHDAMHGDDLRRLGRVSVCCRVDGCDSLGVWTAVTEDVCARGCRIVTRRLPRLGSLLRLTLSSDLFDEALDVGARAMWGTPDRVGVVFVSGAARPGALSPADWLALLVRHGQPSGGGLAMGGRIVPAIRRAAARAALRQDAGRLVQLSRPRDGSALVLPLRGG